MAECAIGILSTIISAESHLYFIEILPSVVNLVDQELKMIAEDSQLLNKRTFEISDVIQCYVNIYTKDDSKPKYSLECEVSFHALWLPYLHKCTG